MSILITFSFKIYSISFTRTPFGPNSKAKFFVSEVNADLDIPYTSRLGAGFKDTKLEILIIQPFDSISMAANSCDNISGARTLMANVAS